MPSTRKKREIDVGGLSAAFMSSSSSGPALQRGRSRFERARKGDQEDNVLQDIASTTRASKIAPLSKFSSAKGDRKSPHEKKVRLMSIKKRNESKGKAINNSAGMIATKLKNRPLVVPNFSLEEKKKMLQALRLNGFEITRNLDKLGEFLPNRSEGELERIVEYYSAQGKMPIEGRAPSGGTFISPLPLVALDSLLRETRTLSGLEQGELEDETARLAELIASTFDKFAGEAQKDHGQESSHLCTRARATRTTAKGTLEEREQYNFCDKESLTNEINYASVYHHLAQAFRGHFHAHLNEAELLVLSALLVHTLKAVETNDFAGDLKFLQLSNQEARLAKPTKLASHLQRWYQGGRDIATPCLLSTTGRTQVPPRGRGQAHKQPGEVVEVVAGTAAAAAHLAKERMRTYLLGQQLRKELEVGPVTATWRIVDSDGDARPVFFGHQAPCHDRPPRAEDSETTHSASGSAKLPVTTRRSSGGDSLTPSVRSHQAFSAGASQLRDRARERRDPDKLNASELNEQLLEMLNPLKLPVALLKRQQKTVMEKLSSTSELNSFSLAE